MANPLDIVYSRKNADGNGFDEKTLVPVSGSFVVCDACGDLTTWSGTIGGGGGGAVITSGSNWNITASWATSASYAYQVVVEATSSNNNYYIPFVVNTGSNVLYIDTSSVYYNPELDFLTAHNISASNIVANGNITITVENGIDRIIEHKWPLDTVAQLNGPSLTLKSADGVASIGSATGGTLLLKGGDGAGISKIGGTIYIYGGLGTFIAGFPDSYYSHGPVVLAFDPTNSVAQGRVSIGGPQNHTALLMVHGNVSASNLKADLEGTASYATSASWSPVPDFPPLDAYLSSSWTGSNSSQFSGTSSFAISASYPLPATPPDLSAYLSASSFNTWTGSNLSQFSGTSSFALTASYVEGGSGAVITSGSSWNLTASVATTAVTASHLYASGSEMHVVNTSKYFVGYKHVNLNTTYSSVLTVTLPELSTVYVELTLNGTHATYGPVLFKGEYVLEKDNIYGFGQPGNIISQYNQNGTIQVQSFLQDISYQTGSAVLGIQLRTSFADVMGSMLYEIKGRYSELNAPFTASATASFGDNFETYAFGPITELFTLSPVFDATAGTVVNSSIGVVAAEDLTAETSGSAPLLNSGFGWAGSGIIN